MGDPTGRAGLGNVVAVLTDLLARVRRLEKKSVGATPAFVSVSASSGVKSLGARSNALSNNPIALAVDAVGNFGYIPSSLEQKTIVGPYTVDMAAWLSQPLEMFTYDGDPTGRVAVGWIAESLDAAGLKEFVVYDAKGRIQGVRVETLVAGLHSAYIQSRTVNIARISALEASMNAAVGAKLRQVFTYANVGALTILASTRDLTITWPVPFADTNYTVVRSFVPPAGVLVNMESYVKSQTTTGCVVTVYTNGVALPAGGTMTVEGLHL